MKKEIEELKVLGANVIELNNSLKLIGDWNEKYNKYHNLFVEITRSLDTSHTIQHKDFLINLTSLGGLYTYNVTQHKDFLRNLASIGELNTNNAIQHPEFLRNLKNFDELKSIPIQHPNFLKNFSDKKNTLETHINNYKL